MSKDIDLKNDGVPVEYSGISTIVTSDVIRWLPEDETGLESLSVTENGEYTPTAFGFSRVVVNVNESPSLTDKEITANGYYSASDDGVDGYDTVTVATAGMPVSLRVDPAMFPVMEGCVINYDGIRVLAQYADGTEVDVTDQCEFSPRAGTYYNGSNDDYTITYHAGGSI